MTRPIHEIARDIYTDWRSQGVLIHFAAKPYLDAMYALDTINDKVGHDSAKSIVLYFLSNARTYRGLKARALKLELKQHLARSK